MKLLVELAEALQAPVVDQRGRMNMPNTHYLAQTGRAAALVGNADVIIGLELSDYWALVNGFVDNGHDGIGVNEVKIKPGTKLIGINSTPLVTKSNYQDFQRFQPVDINMVGDAEASLPSLIEAVKSAINAEHKAAYEKRGEAFKNPVTGEDHFAQVHLPAGFIWKKGECGQGTFRAAAAGVSVAAEKTNWILYEFAWAN